MRPTGLSGPVFVETRVPTTPVPAKDCTTCAALWQQYRTFTDPRRREFDPSRAVDCAVRIRRHPHREDAR